MLKTFAFISLCTCIGVAAHAQTVSDSTNHKKQSLDQQPFFNLIPLKPVLPQDFAVKNLPFFCDKEYKLEKLTKIPFRFRLGSVEYCDKMEGKDK